MKVLIQNTYVDPPYVFIMGEISYNKIIAAMAHINSILPNAVAEKTFSSTETIALLITVMIFHVAATTTADDISKFYK